MAYNTLNDLAFIISNDMDGAEPAPYLSDEDCQTAVFGEFAYEADVDAGYEADPTDCELFELQVELEMELDRVFAVERHTRLVSEILGQPFMVCATRARYLDAGCMSASERVALKSDMMVTRNPRDVAVELSFDSSLPW